MLFKFGKNTEQISEKTSTSIEYADMYNRIALCRGCKLFSSFVKAEKFFDLVWAMNVN